MPNLKILKNWFNKMRSAQKTGQAEMAQAKSIAAFHSHYESFKELLQANADMALILAKFTSAQDGEKILETREIRKLARRAIFFTHRMILALNALSHGKYPDLENAWQITAKKIETELVKHTAGDLKAVAVPLSEVDASMAYILGGKSANLGELRNILGMPVPPGFAVSIKAGIIMLLNNGNLFNQIYSHLKEIDAEKPGTINKAANAIASLIDNAPIPDSLINAALGTWDEVFETNKNTVKIAVRSSAVAEDGIQSFAGQYESVLGVTRSTFKDAIKKVIGSLYSEKALAYRSAHGYALDATGMGLCCIEMIDAKASGVAFSRHPLDLRSNSVLVQGCFGLGEGLVNGSVIPDQWEISRATGKILKCRIAKKNTEYILSGTKTGDGVMPVPLSKDLSSKPCLTDEEVKKIAEMTLQIESHYHYPEDIEWAVNKENEIFLLQARPLSIDCSSPDYFGTDCPTALSAAPPIATGGDVAAKGVACGPVVRIHSNEDLVHFPDGAILLTENSSPNLMTVLRKAGGVITENGSLTGHLASLCREFGIPAIFNLPKITELLHEGQIVTLDALSGRIFDNEVKELLDLKLAPVRKPAPNTAAMVLLRRIMPYILPLHLIEPRSANFTPANCTSLHDIMRFAHEKSYEEMFRLSDTISENSSSSMASKLDCGLPIDLYVIDLGGGLKKHGAPKITPDEIASIPFNALLKGMLNPALKSLEPRPVNIRGFMSVMRESLVGSNMMTGERFGDRSYAIISDRYLNFSSRVGYHYAILDAWCGNTINKNYIRFEFAGGAAGDIQKKRRARCIGKILDKLGFKIEITGDRIRARFQKYIKKEIAARLDQLGRLLIMTRQMDMLMVNDDVVSLFADNFLQGKYH